MSDETTIPATQTKGRARQEVSVIIQDELQIAGVTEESFTALKAEVAALPPDADIASLQKLITKGNRLISTISDAIEPGKKWAHALHKAYTSNENEFIGTVKAIIDPLKEKKAAYQAEQERIEREQNEAREARIRERLVAIEGYEFVRRTGSQGEDDYYMNAGGTRLPMTQVTMSGDEEWANIIKGIEIAWNEEKERKEAAEAAAREEAERIRLAQEAIEEGQRRLKEQQDAFNARINEARRTELSLAGCYFEHDHGIRLSIDEFVPFNMVYSIDDERWAAYMAVAQETKAERDKVLRQLEEQAKREALIAERVKALKEAGWEGVFVEEIDGNTYIHVMLVSSEALNGHWDEMFLWDDADSIARNIELSKAELARRKKVEQDRIAAEAVEAERKRVALQAKLDEEARIYNEKTQRREEQERKAKLTDLDKWNEWVASIKASAPKLSSEIATHAVGRVLKGLDAMTPNLFVEPKK